MPPPVKLRACACALNANRMKPLIVLHVLRVGGSDGKSD
jgi:hypothetical protein